MDIANIINIFMWMCVISVSILGAIAYKKDKLFIYLWVSVGYLLFIGLSGYIPGYTLPLPNKVYALLMIYGIFDYTKRKFADKLTEKI